MRNKRGIIALVVLMMLFLSLACDTSGVDPQDDRLQQPAQNKVDLMLQMIQHLGGMTGGQEPYIKDIRPLFKQNDGSGMWNFDVVIHRYDDGDIKAFMVTPTGCQKGKIGDIADAQEVPLIESTNQVLLHNSNSASDYSYQIQAMPGTLLTVEKVPSDSSSIDLSNNVYVLVSEVDDWSPTLIYPARTLVTQKNLSIQGKAYPGLCMNLMSEGEILDETEVDADGRWTFSSIPLEEGENKFIVTLDNSMVHKNKELILSFEYQENIFAGTAEKVPQYDQEINKYYGRNSDTKGINSNCTWYAAAAVKYWSNQLGIQSTGLPFQIGYGNPYTKWIDNAKLYGYRVDNIPEPGAVIVFNFGHVGFVENVEFSGSSVIITWSEEHYKILNNIGINGYDWGDVDYPKPIVAMGQNSKVWRWTQRHKFSENQMNSGYITIIHFFD